MNDRTNRLNWLADSITKGDAINMGELHSALRDGADEIERARSQLESIRRLSSDVLCGFSKDDAETVLNAIYYHAIDEADPIKPESTKDTP